MSYARMGWNSDVYVFMHVGGWLECCMCHLVKHQDEISFQAYNTETMIAHLKKHIAIQDEVPPDIFDNLIADNKENFG